MHSVIRELTEDAVRSHSSSLKIEVHTEITPDFPKLFPNVRTLIVKTRNIPNEAIFAHLEELETPYISNIATILSSHPQLKGLHVKFDKKEGEDEFMQTTLPNLQVLHLDSMILTDETLEKLNVFVPVLKTLILEKCELKFTDSLKATRHLKEIKKLTFTKVNLSDFQHFHLLLAQCEALAHLELTHNTCDESFRPVYFTDISLIIFSEVKILNLQFCDFGYELMQNFKFPNLIDLNLEYSASHLENFVESSPKIEILRMTGVDYATVALAAKGLKNLKHLETQGKSLDILDVVANHIGRLNDAKIRLENFRKGEHLPLMKKYFEGFGVVEGSPNRVKFIKEKKIITVSGLEEDSYLLLKK